MFTFLLGCPLFLIWLHWIEFPVLCWIWVAECVLLCTRSLKGDSISLTPPHFINSDIAWGLFIKAFIILKYNHYLAILWRVLDHKLCQLIFLFIYSKYQCFHLFLCIICTILIAFHMLSHSHIDGISPTWSWCRMLLMCCWICFVSSLLECLHLCSSEILAYSFSYSIFFVLVSGWWYCPHKITLEGFPLFFKFSKEWY